MSAAVESTTRDVTAFFVCPKCRSDLVQTETGLACTSCGTAFAVRDNVPVLLSDYEDDFRRRYASAYDQIAQDDLAQPFEHDRETRHDVLLKFIGDVRGKRVLDIGSSNAGYLQQIDAAEKVAIDLALPFLLAIPDEAGIAAVCADAEQLPIRPGYFDVVIVSDVLEHLLEPERLMERLKQTCRPDTRLIVHVPWEEDLSKYAQSAYEFTHLRAFDDYTFATLWRYFSIRRERPTYPVLVEPIVFAARRFLPLRVYDRLVHAYFHKGLLQKEYDRRARWIAELPRRERWLLRFYPAAFRMFELRLRREHAAADAVQNDASRRGRIRPTRLR